MLTEDDEMELGVRAELLLQSATFTHVVNHLANTYCNAILMSQPQERNTREDAYVHHRALNDIVTVLNGFVQRKDALVMARQIEEEEQRNG